MGDTDLKSDLMVGIINLISMEEHAFFSWMITNDDKWLDVKKEVGEIRKRQMSLFEKEEDSQLHCFLKHTMASIMRSMECGDKLIRDGKNEESKLFYEDSKKLTDILYKLNFSETETNKKSFIEGMFKWKK